MKFIACMLMAAIASTAQPSNAQTYKYNDRVATQGSASQSYLKSPTYNDRVNTQSFNSNSFLKPNVYTDRVGRSSGFARQSYKQQSFLPQKAADPKSSKMNNYATSMPLKPKASNSTTGSINSKKLPKLKKEDFSAPKTGGGRTSFDRYQIAVPEAPKLPKKR